MYELKIVRTLAVVLGSFVSKIGCTQDVTLPMYMYLANHLTREECLKLAAYLYAEGLEYTAVKELEQDLPLDETCLSLLTTWNNSDGKEKSFLAVANGLKNIGHAKLSEWLSDTVFTHLSMELNSCFLQNTTQQLTNNSIAALHQSQKINSKFKNDQCTFDKSFLFLLLDTIFMYFILMVITVSVLYSLNLFIRAVKEIKKVRSIKKNVYGILELGTLPQDLGPDDDILSPFF